MFERVRISWFTGALWHLSFVAKSLRKDREFGEVPHQFLGVITGVEYIFPSAKSGLFLLTTSFMVLFDLSETLVRYATYILYNE